jgi:methylase of polypeptide subunit release factors
LETLIPTEAARVSGLRRAVGERLTADGFTEAGLKAFLRVPEVPLPSPWRLPLWLARTADESPLASWVRLFILGHPVAGDLVVRHLGGAGVEAWIEAGLLGRDGDALVASVYLQCFRELLIASGFPPESGRECGADHVLGLTPSSRHLANFVIPPDGGRLLDLGTGNGVLALLGSRTADDVVGVDLNPHALSAARLNAALNGVEHVEFRHGDCYAPVASETFDWIVANPPFVISPETQFVYRDGGATGDEFCARLVRRAPAHLREGGHCQLLCNWAHVAGEAWQDRVSSWFSPGIDALVYRSQTTPVDEYAIAWLAVHPDDSPPAHQARFQAWMDYYHWHAIEAVSLGLIAFRKVSGSPGRVRFVEGPVRMNGPCGEQVRNGLDALPLLYLSDEQLINRPLRLDPTVRVRRLSHPVPDGWGTCMAWVERLEGLLHQEVVPEELALALSGADGQRTLGSLVSGPQCLNAVRRLLERGFFLGSQPGM